MKLRKACNIGTTRLEFMIAGGRGFLLMPTRPAPNGSKSWLWYSPTFIGLHPSEGDPNELIDQRERTSNAWFIKRLLEHGLYVAGLEVGESYGNPIGREQYTEFYHYLVDQFGLSVKTCLYSQSRGGLQNFNWALEHPDWVLCITGCQVVLDIRLYPGLDKACGVYDMTAEQLEASLEEHNPIDRSMAPLAQAKVPIMHVLGDRDGLVPVEQTMDFARRYWAHGGSMQVIVNPGIGHGNEPELLAEPRILDFILAYVFPEKK
jgi:hypothetical protein